MSHEQWHNGHGAIIVISSTHVSSLPFSLFIYFSYLFWAETTLISSTKTYIYKLKKTENLNKEEKTIPTNLALRSSQSLLIQVHTPQQHRHNPISKL